MPRTDVQQEANQGYQRRFDDEMRELIRTFDGDDYGSDEYEDALERLEGMPLSFERVVTNHRKCEIEWEILLGTGGPADRVYVVTDDRGIVQSAEYQYQDWFTPWTTAEGQDEALVRRFAEIVGYYEDQG